MLFAMVSVCGQICVLGNYQQVCVLLKGGAKSQIMGIPTNMWLLEHSQFSVTPL